MTRTLSNAAGAATEGHTQRTQRAARAHPILEQLAGLYPHLFGECLPLKRGIFQDLQDAHPDVLDRDGLKTALALHTRSTRYLVGVAAGHKRHDLQGNAVEDMAPEHVYQALLEVFRRRQGRTNEDLKPKLRQRIVQAFEASGLSRADYGQLVRMHNEAANAMLDEALAEVGARAAKDEALRRAFEASGQTGGSLCRQLRHGRPVRQPLAGTRQAHGRLAVVQRIRKLDMD